MKKTINRRKSRAMRGNRNSVGNMGGRPSKYHSSFCRKAIEYVDSCEETEYDYQTLRGEKADGFQYRIKPNIPCIEGLAILFKVNRSTIFDWKAKYTEFANALDYLMSVQKMRLMNHGLANDYSPALSKLILAANHGMKEDQSIDITSLGKKITGITYLVPKGAEDPE